MIPLIVGGALAGGSMLANWYEGKNRVTVTWDCKYIHISFFNDFINERFYKT